MGRVIFKQAETTNEFDQIHALNHRVFAEEIGQHEVHRSGLLIDRFHNQNRYFVAVRDGVVIGMISAHAGPEFSITKRLPDATVLKDFDLPVEVRLLAIAPHERSNTVLAGLLWQVYHYARSNGFSHLLISGIRARESMYRKLGFHPLGPVIPEGSADFIPMVMAVRQPSEVCEERIRLHERGWSRRTTTKIPVSLMPGPVYISPSIAGALAAPPLSHRSSAFIDLYERTRFLLNGLLGGAKAVLFTGTGTLANDVVAANLKAIFGDDSGLVISNGEFGERIAVQAEKAALKFQQLSFGWGDEWSFPAVRSCLAYKPKWIWAVQLETSTGVLNDTEALLGLATEHGCGVALDCVSSVGAIPITEHASPLLLASGVSGKSLGAYAGLSFIYVSDECQDRLAGKSLCPSFDLLRMQQTRGPVSTIPSPLVAALARALEENYSSAEATAQRYREYASVGREVRRLMRENGLEPLAQEGAAAPNITTFRLPGSHFSERCLRAGYQIAHESPYLQRCAWGQIATMGVLSLPLIEGLFQKLRDWGA